MKKQIFFKILFCVILFISETLSSGIKVKSFLDKNKVFIGERVKYVIDVEHSLQYKLDTFEISVSSPQSFVLIEKDIKKLKKLFSKDVGEKINLYFLALQLGKYSIEETKLNFVIENSTETKTISLPKKEVEILNIPKPKNVKFDGEIVDIVEPIWMRNYLLLIFLLLGTILGLVLYSVKKRKEIIIEEQVETIVDIKEDALRRLAELWQKDYITKNLVKEFYLELTEIVKDYIGKKNNINALELTTDELYYKLKNIVDRKYNLKLKTFLDNADLSKFAKYVPDVKQINSDFDVAKELIEIL
ncbi:MAG: hypothetical protein SNJ64_05280 [Endomicrobiia bacterium]